jgi:hypothetical protein
VPCYGIVNVEKNWVEAAVIVVGGGKCAIFTLPDGRTGYCKIEGDDVKFAWLAADYATGGSWVTIDTSGDYDSVDCTSDGHVVRVIARHSDTHALYQWHSFDDGATWVGPNSLG